MALHVIKTDVLLWQLSAFADEDPELDPNLGDKFVSREYIRAVKRFVVAYPVKSPLGSIKDLAARFEHSLNATQQHVSWCRRGLMPVCWGCVSI